MVKQNLHTHTAYCDGKNTPREMIEIAIRKDFTSLGFSGHSYMTYSPSHSMTMEGTQEYVREINQLKQEYADRIQLFCGLATDEQARGFMAKLDLLEAEYGILANAKNDVVGSNQWGYPNGWACHQMLFISALDQYGYTDDARRIAEKYITLTNRVFAETENLWEKYNVVEGSILVEEESETSKMPAMMGWSAGTYLYAQAYLS